MSIILLPSLVWRHSARRSAAAGALLAIGSGALACAPEAAPPSPVEISAVLDSVSPAQWSALASRRVYFAHMSVGGNIVDGIAVLVRERPDLGLRLVRSSDPDSVEGGALIHNFVGENGDPTGKCADFARIILSAQHRPVDVGAQKFCYADFGKQSDPDSVFAEYARRTEALRNQQPGLRIVHVTAPLLVSRFDVKDVARKILGKMTSKEQLAKVRRFNDLLRARYAGVDPIFDLAALEASGGLPYTTLPADQSLAVSIATPDGGHLNEAGQRALAAHFLAFLATLQPTSAS